MTAPFGSEWSSNTHPGHNPYDSKSNADAIQKKVISDHHRFLCELYFEFTSKYPPMIRSSVDNVHDAGDGAATSMERYYVYDAVVAHAEVDRNVRREESASSSSFVLSDSNATTNLSQLKSNKNASSTSYWNSSGPLSFLNAYDRDKLTPIIYGPSDERTDAFLQMFHTSERRIEWLCSKLYGKPLLSLGSTAVNVVGGVNRPNGRTSINIAEEGEGYEQQEKPISLSNCSKTSGATDEKDWV